MVDESDPVERRAKEAWLRKRQNGEDVGPFSDWFATRRSEFEKPSSRAPPPKIAVDEIGPAPDLGAMMREQIEKIRTEDEAKP